MNRIPHGKSQAAAKANCTFSSQLTQLCNLRPVPLQPESVPPKERVALAQGGKLAYIFLFQSLFLWHAFNYALTLNFLGVANIISVCIMIIMIHIIILIIIIIGVFIVVEVYFNCQPQRRLFAPLRVCVCVCLPRLFCCSLFIYLRARPNECEYG